MYRRFGGRIRRGRGACRGRRGPSPNSPGRSRETTLHYRDRVSQTIICGKYRLKCFPHRINVTGLKAITQTVAASRVRASRERPPRRRATPARYVRLGTGARRAARAAKSLRLAQRGAARSRRPRPRGPGPAARPGPAAGRQLLCCMRGEVALRLLM